MIIVILIIFHFVFYKTILYITGNSVTKTKQRYVILKFIYPKKLCKIFPYFTGFLSTVNQVKYFRSLNSQT